MRVSKDDSVELDTTVELPATEDPSISTSERTPVECAWDDGDGEYVIEAGLSDEQLQSHDVVAHADNDCAYVEIEIFWDDTITFKTWDCAGLAPGRREPPWGCPVLQE